MTGVDIHGRGNARRRRVVVRAAVRTGVDQFGDRHDAVGAGRILAGVAVGERVDQRLQLRRGQRCAREGQRRDAVPRRVTVTVSPLVAVTIELPLVSAMGEPSKLRISLAPSVTLVTVSVIDVKVCPASIVEAVTPLKMSAAAPPSVKVGSSAVAASVGSSLIARDMHGRGDGRARPCCRSDRVRSRNRPAR